MTTTDDRPTLPERYARSIDSRHLELLTDKRCSIDMLIAAGWARESLGTALFRLRAEFDQVRGQQHHAQRALTAMAAAAQAHRSAGARLDAPETLRVEMNRQADALDRDAHNAGLTARVLILSVLKTLSGTKQALGRFALITATRERYMQDDAAVMRIAGQALEVWLDPLCLPCNGTGAVGGFGAPRSICTHCHGSTRRAVRFGADPKSHDFGRGLLAAMDRKTDRVTAQMRRFLSTKA